MKRRPTNIRLAEAAEMLNVSRQTMHKIAEQEGLKKFRRTDGRTSPWYFKLAEIERYEKMRMEL